MEDIEKNNPEKHLKPLRPRNKALETLKDMEDSATPPPTLKKAITMAREVGQSNTDEVVNFTLHNAISQSIPDESHLWYKEAIFYEVYVRAFCDSNGDGIGDLPGKTFSS